MNIIMKVMKDGLLKLVLMLSVVFVVSCEEQLPDGDLYADKYTPSGKLSGHEYVDLGLPSGTKWAICNVGATRIQDHGGYYAWGETKVKSSYDWSTYKWSDDEEGYVMTKYFNKNDILAPEDDVAQVKWGGNWRMPTLGELQELSDNCTWTLTNISGVNGYKVTSKTNGNSIFLPAAGLREDAGCDYWTSSLSGSSEAFSFLYEKAYRCYGGCVRPVFGDSIYVGVKCTVSVDNSGGGSVAIKNSSELSIEFKKYSTVTVVATPDKGYGLVGWYIGDVSVSTDTEYTFTISEDVELVARFELKPNINGYEYVDLGLPSGLKWAAYNVGASYPEEYGCYYAWGAVEEQSNYDLSTYKWNNGSDNIMTKYCIDSDHGTVDNKTVLAYEDDAAHVKWGGAWRMPTLAEMDELLANCTWTWATQNEVKGYKVTGPNGNSIFLPATGSRLGTELHRSGSSGFYWSSTLSSDDSRNACYMGFGISSRDWSNCARYTGGCVRPVCDDAAKYTITICGAGNGTVTIKDNPDTSVTLDVGSVVTVVATPDDGYTFEGWFVNDVSVSTDAEYTFTVTDDVVLVARFAEYSYSSDGEIGGYEYVDLGLPSGLKWATCNVGASAPEDYGGYYAWGETEEKDNYSWNTYKWCKGSSDTMTKYCTDSSYGTVDNKTVLDPQDDVAHVKWGDTWRIPNWAEQDELRNNCTWTWTTQNGVNGYKVTGPNGNSIFLPAAGYRYGPEADYRGSHGLYWSSSLSSYDSGCAYYLSFYSGRQVWGSYYRCLGRSVRPVSQ